MPKVCSQFHRYQNFRTNSKFVQHALIAHRWQVNQNRIWCLTYANVFTLILAPKPALSLREQKLPPPMNQHSAHHPFVRVFHIRQAGHTRCSHLYPHGQVVRLLLLHHLHFQALYCSTPHYRRCRNGEAYIECLRRLYVVMDLSHAVRIWRRLVQVICCDPCTMELCE